MADASPLAAAPASPSAAAASPAPSPASPELVAAAGDGRGDVAAPRHPPAPVGLDGSSATSDADAAVVAASAVLRVLREANAPVVGVGPDGRISVWNRRLTEITGFAEAAAVGRRLHEFVYGALGRARVVEALARCVGGGASALEVHVPLRTTTGRNAQMLTNMTPLMSADGRCVGVYGVGQDVTEWTLQEKQYANVLTQANAPIIEIDKDANITVWNAKTASMTGFASDDMVGEPLLPIVDPSFQDVVAEHIEQTLRTGIAGADFELPLMTAIGSRVEILLCLTPRFDAGGTVAGLVAIGQDVTERNAKEMEYRKLIETANAPIFGVDTEGRVVIFNTKASLTSEYSPEEVIGTDLVETLISEEFRPAVAAVFQKAFQGIETANFEFPLITKSGRKVEILLNATPRYDHTGKLAGVVGIGQDITERIIQEHEYSRLIDTANAPIFGVNCDYEVIIWNKKAAAITQFDNEDAIGKELFTFISADYRDAVARVLSRALEGTETANFEFPLVTKSGRKLDILLNATPKYDHFGNICGVVGIGQDITDRRAQEQEYMRLIDTANAPIFGVDRDCCVTIWNRKAAQITGYAVNDVLGANLVDSFIPPDFQDDVGRVLSEALKGIETANFEFPLMTNDGRRLEILLNATPRYDELGGVIGVVGIGQDITVRIAQEKETSRLIDSANAPIFGVDQEGRINIWNLKAAEITQHTQEEVMGKDLVNEFVADAKKSAVRYHLQRALQGDQSTKNFDFPLITKAGRRVEILLNATPRYDEMGQIFGVVGIGQDITERIAQEQEYIRLIDTANAPIFGVDGEGRVNIWNKKAAEIMQYTTSTVIGEKLVEKFISEDYRGAVDAVLSNALQGTETANFEFPLITKSGRRVEILLNATPRYNEHGKIIGMVGIGQDITDRIAQEQEYLRLIDTANAPIFGVDSNGLVNIWNRKAANITQYTNDDVLGEDLVEKFISEGYRFLVRSVLEKAFQGVETANFEFPLITKAGRRVEILLNATPRYNEHGEVIGMVGIGQDITDRIAQEQEYTRLIDTANAPIFGVDSNGRVNIWNRKAADITQYSNEEVMGEDLVEKFISEEYRQPVRSVLLSAFEGVDTANFEFPLITKAGRRVEILLNATPRYNEHGDVMGMVGIGQDITDRIAQEQEYTRLIDTANAPIFGVDADGSVNIWNRKAADIMQYTNEDVLGEDLVEKFISEEYRVPVRSVLEKAFEGVETANFEFPLITKAGRRVEILLNATPRFNEHGEVMGMVGIGQDITDRIAQEQEYSRLIDTANAPIFGIDANMRINILNRKAAQITNYTFEEVEGRRYVETFISPEYRSIVREIMQKALQGDDTASFDVPVITKTGRKLNILLNATARFDQHGHIVGVVGIGQDITDRIAQEHEYARLIDSANAPIFGVDSKGCVTIWNKKAAEITQYTPSDVMGESLVDKFITEDYRDAVGYVLSKALNGQETANFEFPLVTKTGRRVEILLNATSRYNEHGEVMGMVGIGQDITERIAQEQEYTRLIDTANAPIFGVDSNGLVNIWNRKAANITQYTNDDVLGEDLVEKFISEGYRFLVRSVLEKAFEGVETANFEFPLITKAGRRVEILLNATPRYNEHGEVIGMVGIGQDITDRIAQEQEYTRLIDTANAPIFGVDSSGRVNIWNRKAADITQYSNEEVMGEDLVEKFISEEYRVPVRSVLETAFEGVETSNFEFPLISKTGRRVEILLNATPRYNEHGEVMGMVGIGQDITDRIAQEQEYSRLIDSANAPIFGVDANMCVNIWNRKAAQITNYSIEEVMGENLVETFISPEFRPAVADVLSKALKGEETANFEFPLITRPGTRIEILLNATPRNDANGNIVGVVGIGQDITDRIAQEHEYFRLIDTANAPIFGIDTNGCVNEWNQKIEEITGYHKSTVLGMSLVHTFITPESRQQVRQLLNQALIGIDVGEMELPMTTKRGTFLLLLVNASSKKDMHGNIRGVIGVGQDYTARKHMEAAKVNFLASFSHELRTPLNGVLGMLELLKDQKLDKAPERYVHMAYVSGSLLLNLINDILDLSKIEAGHLEITAAPFQMNDLLDYSIEIFKFKARERNIKLVLKCDDNVPQLVIGDVIRLRQVLLNLLSNAVKFTNKGSITVTCSVIHSPDLPPEFKKLLFQVIDTGIGMDAEEKSRLFSLFTKLERTRQNNPTGSGLGLAICKQLVELMDGQIDVDSELGIGSNFFFTVIVRLVDDIDPRDSLYGDDELKIDQPLLSPSSNADGSSATIDGVSSGGAPKVTIPSHARILVVEDNEFNWEVVKCFLQEDDHFLQWEMNGRDAVRAYVQNPASFDLIFMDCEMPIMDGYAATAAIRDFEKDNRMTPIPVLGLTAYAMSGDRQKCLDAGMDEFMVKPISKLSLRKAIRQWMRVRYNVGRQPGEGRGRMRTESATMALSGQSTQSSAAASGYPAPTPTPRPSIDFDEVKSYHVTPPPRSRSGSRLAPASRHMQQLDLARAISNLELDDPLAIGCHGVVSRASLRVAGPTTSIFSVGSSAGANSSRSGAGSSLLTFRRDAGGAIVDIPDWKQEISQTSATLPCPANETLYEAATGGVIGSEGEPRSPKHGAFSLDPTVWSHPPFLGSGTRGPPSSASSPTKSMRAGAKRSAAQGNLNAMPSADDSEGGDSQRMHDDPVAAMMEKLKIKTPPTSGGSDKDDGDEAAENPEQRIARIEIPAGDPVDYSLGVTQCGGREELFLSLLEKFATNNCETVMARLIEAHAVRDLPVLRRESHSLKGSAAYVAALRVSKAAFRVQVACEIALEREGSPEVFELIDETVTTLRKEHRLLRGYLQRNFEFGAMLSHSGPMSTSSSSSSLVGLKGSSSQRARQSRDAAAANGGPCGVM